MLAYARACAKRLTQITALHPHTTALPWGRYHWCFCFMPQETGSGRLSAQWHQLGSGSSNLKPVVYTVLFDWLTLEFHSTNCCWRKVKTHLLHQPRVLSSSGSPVCVCCCPHPAGCPPTPDANFRQLFFFPSWLLWGSEKRHSWLVYSTLFRPVNCLRALTSPCQ